MSHHNSTEPHERLAAILQSIGSPRILVVGDIMLDRYVHGEVTRICPEAPAMVLRGHQTDERLGGAGAVAVMLAKIGAKVTLAGNLGRDVAGETVRRLMERADIQSAVRYSVDYCTTVKERFIGHAAGSPSAQLLRVDWEPNERPDNEPIDLPACDAVVFADHGKGVCSPALVRAMIAACRERGIVTLADPPAGSDWMDRYRGCNILKLNRREALAAAPTAGSARVASVMIQRDVGADACVVTIDSQGMMLADRDTVYWFLPSRDCNVRDVTGAGDMVMAVLALVTAAGHNIPAASQIANVAAGIQVECVGATPVPRDDIIRELCRARRDAHPSTRKLCPPDILAMELRRRRAAGQKIVFTNGCFDIFHAGHAAYLAQARAMGDVLVVGLNTDASVRRLKGPGRPINSEYDRAAVLASLASVDYVCLFDDDTPLSLIEAFEPDVLVKGGDYTPSQVVGREIVEARGGRVAIVPRECESSTSAVVERAAASMAGVCATG